MTARIQDQTSRLLARSTALLNHKLMRCGVPVSACEDCAQEAWLALLSRHPDWKPDESRTWAWLLAVARNKALDFHRQSRVHRCQSLDDSFSSPFSYPPEALREVGADSPHQEIVSELQDGLDRLSEVNHELFIQRVQGGLSYREIGEGLGLTPAQVKNRYHRAVKKLRGRRERKQ
jgi:RNA polymerase sigma-70 factor, ECF subfamily